MGTTKTSSGAIKSARNQQTIIEVEEDEPLEVEEEDNEEDDPEEIDLDALPANLRALLESRGITDISKLESSLKGKPGRARSGFGAEYKTLRDRHKKEIAELYAKHGKEQKVKEERTFTDPELRIHRLVQALKMTGAHKTDDFMSAFRKKYPKEKLTVDQLKESGAIGGASGGPNQAGVSYIRIKV